MKLAHEELNQELIPAIMERDLVATADGIIDSIYVLVGMGLELGLPLEDLWDEVQRANMSKTVPLTDGRRGVLKRGDGKILKPPGWTPPDIEGVLRKHGWVPPPLVAQPLSALAPDPFGPASK